MFKQPAAKLMSNDRRYIWENIAGAKILSSRGFNIGGTRLRRPAVMTPIYTLWTSPENFSS